MKPRRPVVSPEDQALFLAAVGGTTPLDTRDRIPVPPPPPSPVRPVELPSAVALTVEGHGRRYAARAPGLSPDPITQLRGGHVPAPHTHGLPTATAEPG